MRDEKQPPIEATSAVNAERPGQRCRSALGMLTAPAEKRAGTVVGGVTHGIDHEAERADLIFA